MTYITITLMISQPLFAKTYGGPDRDEATSIIQTSNGEYVVAGSTMSFGSGNEDVCLIKLYGFGGLAWVKAFGGVDREGASSIIQTSDGGYAVAGWTGSYGSGFGDFLVLKLNSYGGLDWAETFGWAVDKAHSIIQTSDGGYAVVGSMFSYGSGFWDFLVLKLNSYGGLDWAERFGGTNFDEAFSIIQTSDGGYVVAGYTENFGAGSYDCLIIKLTSSGALQWAKTFGGTAWDDAASIIQTSDGGYVVAGRTMSYGLSDFDVFILKLDNFGDLEWAKTFGDWGHDYPSSIIQTTDGGYAIAAITQKSIPAGPTDILLLKLTSSGDLSWAKTFGGASTEEAHSIVQTSDGNLAVAGFTTSFGAGVSDFLVLKLASDGSYPGCLVDWSPILVTTPAPITSTLSIGTNSSPFVTNPTPNLVTQSLIVTDVCAPGSAGESDILPGRTITCFPLPGAVIFNSQDELGIKIYSADGRVAYSGQLQKGENRIALGQGVYLWQVGDYKGKVAVR